ncbi:uncharacterized protein LOC118502147 isoform X1 [Phyllostomus discolor]|uniref:Uncharacterized protein LOC118502147 isoform X1 n=1 Tax=Phyllostomus discolor TaxID=89673 RepID=A0A7E6EEA6_9CHIR|nr:uncharacterized protein LOC118502147 isoform X1 [Phyllostomus discolor]
MPRVNHPGDVRAATLMHCGRAAQGRAFRAAAAAPVLSPALFWTPDSVSRCRPPSLFFSSSRPPFMGKIPNAGGRGLHLGEETALGEARTDREATSWGLGRDSSLPASQKKSQTLIVRSELASLTPPPPGCWGEGRSGEGGGEVWWGLGTRRKFLRSLFLQGANAVGFSLKVENQRWSEDVTPRPHDGRKTLDKLPGARRKLEKPDHTK